MLLLLVVDFVDVVVVLSSLDCFHLKDDLDDSELDDLIQDLNVMMRVAVQRHCQ